MTEVLRKASALLRSGFSALDDAKAPGADAWVVLALVVVVVALWCVGFATPSFSNPDAFDYAQMGRELAQGDGLSTTQAFPRHVPFLRENGYLPGPRWPNLYRYPLTPLSNGVAQLFVEDPAVAAAGQSGFYYLCTVVLSYLLARRFCGRRLSVLCVLLLLTDHGMWDAAYDGMTETLASALVLAVFLALTSKSTTVVSCTVLGLLCGLSILGRTQLVILLPVALFARAMVLRQLGRPVWLCVFVVVGALAAMLPWWLRSYSLSGNMLFNFSTARHFILGTSDFHSDIEMRLHVPVSLSALLGTHGGAVFSKFLANLGAIRHPSVLVGYWFPPFCLLGATGLASLLSRFRPGHRQIARYALWLCLSSNFLVVCAVFVHPRFFLPFMPLILVVGVADLSAIAGVISGERVRRFALRLLPVGVLVVVPFLAAITVNRALTPVEDHGQYRRGYGELASLVPAGELIVSDVSHHVSFELGHPTLRLPAFPDELYEINERYVPVSFLVLSRRFRQRFARPTEPSQFESYNEYRGHLESPKFQSTFEKITVLENGSAVYRLR